MAANQMVKRLVWAITILALSNAGIGFCCYYNAVRVDILEKASQFHFFLFLYIIASLILAIYAIMWLTLNQVAKHRR